MKDRVQVQDLTAPSRTEVGVENAIRAIEESAAFQRAPVLRRLLLYLWEHRNDESSEYGIGVDVLGRKPEFDPKIDATVRVHVSRLRQKLRDFYASSHNADLPARRQGIVNLRSRDKITRVQAYGSGRGHGPARLRRIVIAGAGNCSISSSGGPLERDSGPHHGTRETFGRAWRI